MQQINAEEFIEQLKNYFNLNTDEDLAARLDMTQPAITHWRRRGIPRKILRKYKTLISGAGEKVVVAEQPIHIQKGEQPVDASYIIDLQKDKIESQKKEIARLNTIVNQQKETKNKPAFHFKTKCNYDHKTLSFSNHEVYGDVDMTGFTLNELNAFTAEKWIERFHPDSLQTIMATTNPDPPIFVHNIWKHILWKSKNDKYLMFNIESYYSRDEKIIRSYYYWVNGDIEGKS